MAKSSLQFLEKRNVDVYDSDSYAIRSLVKEDCGKIIVLSNAKAHTLTLPTAAIAGEGWNCRFIVGTVHTDRSVRDLTTIAAQGSETVNMVATKTGGALAGGAKSTRVDIIDTAVNDGVAGIKAAAAVGADPAAKQTNLTKEDFTITVPVAAGGTGTAFRFKFVTLDADLTATNSAANEAEISVENLADNDAIQVQIVKVIKGEAVGAGTRVPASGDGLPAASGGEGIQGITAADGGAASRVTITADHEGLAGDAITVALVGAHGDASADVLGAGTASQILASGANRTGVSLATRTIQITEGASVGDQVELIVVNGQWQARSFRAQ